MREPADARAMKRARTRRRRASRRSQSTSASTSRTGLGRDELGRLAVLLERRAPTPARSTLVRKVESRSSSGSSASTVEVDAEQIAHRVRVLAARQPPQRHHGDRRLRARERLAHLGPTPRPLLHPRHQRGCPPARSGCLAVHRAAYRRPLQPGRDHRARRAVAGPVLAPPGFDAAAARCQRDGHSQAAHASRHVTSTSTSAPHPNPGPRAQDANSRDPREQMAWRPPLRSCSARM